jgi:hypothetical protein
MRPHIFALGLIAGTLLAFTMPPRAGAQVEELPTPPGPTETAIPSQSPSIGHQVPSLGFSEGLGLLGLALALLSLPPIATRIWRPGARLAYQTRSDQLVDLKLQPFIEAVQLKLGRRRIERLTLTTLIVWNAGRDAVRAADLDPQDPIRFQFSDGARILHHTLVAVSPEGFKVSVSVDSTRPNELVCQIPYLNPSAGFVIDVWHTGTKVKPHPLGAVQGPSKWFDNRGEFAALMVPKPLSTFIASQGATLSLFFVFFVDIDSVPFKRDFPPTIGHYILHVVSFLLIMPFYAMTWLRFSSTLGQPPRSLGLAAQFNSEGSRYRTYKDL